MLSAFKTYAFGWQNLCFYDPKPQVLENNRASAINRGDSNRELFYTEQKTIQKNPSTVLNCNLNEVFWYEVDTKTINERKEKKEKKNDK